MSSPADNEMRFFGTILACIFPPNPPRMDSEQKVSRTPLDRYGFRTRCCRCIPLKPAAFIICLLSFIWVALELVALDKYIGRLFLNKDEVFEYFKMCYMVLVILFGVICGIFLVGIIAKKYIFASVFVWCAFIFNSIYIVIYIVSIIMSAVNNTFTKRLYLKIVFAVAWNFLYCYFLIIVNSYRIMLWVDI